MWGNNWIARREGACAHTIQYGLFFLVSCFTSKSNFSFFLSIFSPPYLAFFTVTSDSTTMSVDLQGVIYHYVGTSHKYLRWSSYITVMFTCGGFRLSFISSLPSSDTLQHRKKIVICVLLQNGVACLFHFHYFYDLYQCYKKQQ